MTSAATRSAELQFIDISIPYASAVAVWPGDVPFSCGWTARREAGSSVNLGAITTSTHAGTHADAPLHVEASWGASESLQVDAFVGDCVVVALEDALGNSVITFTQLQELLQDVVPSRLLVCTGHSVAAGSFPAAWPVLDEQAANWLIARGLRLFGTDAPSVDARDSKTLPVHHCVFEGGAFVLENLSLSHVAPGSYELLAQPLAIVGADAAPVRALLR